MSLKERTLANLEERRERLLNGDINSIPTPFKRFEDDFIGIEQSTYYAITAATKGSKSQFTSFVFIYKALLFAYWSKANVKVTIFYFPLEETPERVMQRFMSFLLYDLTKGEVRISPRDLRSSVNTKPLSEDVLELLRSDEFSDILDYFENNIIFSTESNPTGIYKFCRSYAEMHGTTYYKDVCIKDEFGIEKTVKMFDRYEMENPNEFRIIIIDTINLIDTENGLSTKESMDKLSEYLAKKLRNRYYFSPVVIQQQAFAGESNDAFKIGKVEPSLANLGDSRYISRDANIVLGLFSPVKFKIGNYLGYDIKKFKDNIRFLFVLANRDGEMGGVLPLYFDGATCTFAELPRPDNAEGIGRVYRLLDKIRTTNVLMFTFNKYFNNTFAGNKIKKYLCMLFSTNNKYGKNFSTSKKRLW